MDSKYTGREGEVWEALSPFYYSLVPSDLQEEKDEKEPDLNWSLESEIDPKEPDEILLESEEIVTKEDEKEEEKAGLKEDKKEEEKESISLDFRYALYFMDKYKQKFFVNPEKSNSGYYALYQYDDVQKVWVPLNKEQLATFIYQWLRKKKKVPKLATVARFHRNVAEHVYQLIVDKSAQPKQVPVIAFTNGLILIEQSLFIPLSPSYFYTHVIPARYKGNEGLPELVKKIFLLMFKNDLEAINHLRGILRRCLHPFPELQTGLVIKGPPGTGKSTLATVFKKLIGYQDYVEFSRIADLSDKFARESLRGVKILMINDTTTINEESKTQLRAILGRDGISSSRKHSQEAEGSSFICKAVVIMTSNENPTTLFGFDQALYSRFICVETPVVPKTRIEGLPSALTKPEHLVGIVNWALTVPSEVLKHQIRASNRESISFWAEMPLSEFIAEKVAVDTDGCISTTEMLRIFKEWVEETHKERSRVNQGRFNRNVLEVLAKVFCQNVVIGRPRKLNKVMAFMGIKWKGDKDLPLKVPNYLDTEAVLEELDPFWFPPLPRSGSYLDVMTKYDQLEVREDITSLVLVDMYGKMVVESTFKRLEDQEVPSPNRGIPDQWESSFRERLTHILNKENTIHGVLLKWISYLGSQLPPFDSFNLVPYNPHMRYPLWQEIAQREFIVRAHAWSNIAFAKFLPNQEELWQEAHDKFRDEPACRKYMYTPAGKAIERQFKGSLFPLDYMEKENHPRVVTIPSNTVSTVYRPLKAFLLRRIQEEVVKRDESLKGFFGEIDLTGAHLHAAVNVAGREKAPLVAQSLEDENFWVTQIQEVFPKYLDVEGINTSHKLYKPLKSILKVRLLLAINGGNPNSQRNIESVLSSGVHLKLGLPVSVLESMLLDIGSTWLPLQQLTKASRFLQQKSVYVMDREYPIHHDSSYKSLSTIWSSFESFVVSVVIETVWGINQTMVLAIEHDGILVYNLNAPISESTIDAINERLKTLSEKMGWSIPLRVDYKDPFDV